MLVFLFKSTACLAIFLVFYKLVLEKESVHHFKRFFLLGALLASFIIPNLVFTEYVDTTPNTDFVSAPTTITASEAHAAQKPVEESSFDWEMLLWGFYLLGVLGFGLRFITNLLQLHLRIKKNPKFKENFVTKVLLKQSLPPHTFFNYIFLNKEQFEEQNIPQEVILHEETHAKQRHSLDILLIEIAQVLLWFNPILYPFKSSIKLNHEFLADRAVINKNNNRSHYQNTILSYLSHDSFNKYQSTGIANAINYSSIKKRFTVMKTNTSKKSFVFRSLLLLPLTTLLLFGFSEHREIAREIPTDHIITMNLLGIETVQIQDEIVHFNEVAQVLNQEYLSTYDSEKTKVEINAVQPVYLNTINNLSKEIRTTGIDFIEVFAHEVIMEESQFKENVPITPSTTLLNAKQMTIVDSKVQLQQSATREEMKEYNALAKKYNDMDRDRMHIKGSEVRRLKEIYGKMSKKQQADAEPFPDFPAPPPAPPAPVAAKTPKNVSEREYASNQIETIIEEQDPYDIVGGGINTKEKPPKPPMPPSPVKNIKEAKPVGPSNPPAPPVPPKPVEHIKKMAAKGAKFMFNGKEITAKKAIEIVENNNKINIDSRGSKGENPIVRLSVDPIEIDN